MILEMLNIIIIMYSNYSIPNKIKLVPDERIYYSMLRLLR